MITYTQASKAKGWFTLFCALSLTGCGLTSTGKQPLSALPTLSKQQQAQYVINAFYHKGPTQFDQAIIKYREINGWNETGKLLAGFTPGSLQFRQIDWCCNAYFTERLVKDKDLRHVFYQTINGQLKSNLTRLDWDKNVDQVVLNALYDTVNKHLSSFNQEAIYQGIQGNTEACLAVKVEAGKELPADFTTACADTRPVADNKPIKSTQG